MSEQSVTKLILSRNNFVDTINILSHSRILFSCIAEILASTIAGFTASLISYSLEFASQKKRNVSAQRRLKESICLVYVFSAEKRVRSSYSVRKPSNVRAYRQRAVEDRWVGGQRGQVALRRRSCRVRAVDSGGRRLGRRARQAGHARVRSEQPGRVVEQGLPGGGGRLPQPSGGLPAGRGRRRG